MSTAPTLFEATRLRTPRPTEDRPIPTRPLQLGDHAHPISLMSPKGWPSGEVVALYGPDGKGNGPRATLRMFRTDDRRTFALDDLRRHAKAHEIVEDFYAEKYPVVVIPCGGKKLTEPAPAGDLYIGSQHRLARQAADTLARNLGARVLILSAKHGLLDLETVVEPYDMTIDHPNAVTAQDVAHQLIGMDARTIIALTPKGYTNLLRGRVGTRIEDRLAGTSGIFEQRTILSTIKNGTDLR